MKKVIILHGWESNPTEHWYQEEKEILEEMGFEVHVPEMPGGSIVKEKEWVKVISALKPNENTILIGHSLGAPTILRYLESNNVKVNKVILIAGFASPLKLKYPNTKYPQKFVERSFNWKKIKEGANKFIILNQDNDEWVPIEKGEELAKKLGGKLFKVKGTDHFDKINLGLINQEIE